MIAIAAVDANWGIGKNNKLLFRLKEDMEFFKKMTTGKVVVMGRKTFESLPNGKPLKNRLNLVITSQPRESYDNVIFGTMEEILEEIKKHHTNDVFIIGGESIYKQFIGLCDMAYITHVNKVYDADAHMPRLLNEGFKFHDVIESHVIEDDIYWHIDKWIRYPI